MLHFEASDKGLHLDISAFFTNQSYEGKKMQLILFINGRLVNCKTIRQTVEGVFATFLGKTTKPFVYLGKGSNNVNFTSVMKFKRGKNRAQPQPLRCLVPTSMLMFIRQN